MTSFSLQRCSSVQLTGFRLDCANQRPSSTTQPPSSSSSTVTSSSSVCTSGFHDDDTSPVFRDISVQTVAAIVTGSEPEVNGKKFEKHIVIDARYEYEYQGGHIKGALSIPFVERKIYEKKLQNLFFDQNGTEKILSPKDNNDNVIIIFHCEFSSHRGPELRKCFRELDRKFNKYPSLSYRNLFLMKNGFKEFYKLILPVCAYGVTSGREYCPELNPENSKDRNETKLRRKKEKNKEHIKRSYKDILRDRTGSNNTSTPVRTGSRRRTRRNSKCQK
jgi:rhodanese-related sulfurtransferase